MKWGKLKDKEGELRVAMERVEWKVQGSVQEMWKCVASKVRECCKKVLGVVKAGRKSR